MKYIALLRGIYVGGTNIVEMNRLKILFESLGFTNISTYINSGNVIFKSDDNPEIVSDTIITNFEVEFGVSVPILVKLQSVIIKIAEKIPSEWQNDKEQKTDVAYLFPQIDNNETIELLPLNREFIDVRYTKGAIFWNVKREDQNKSQLNKLAGNKLYKLMTVRNIRTARYLENWNV